MSLVLSQYTSITLPFQIMAGGANMSLYIEKGLLLWLSSGGQCL